MSTKTTVETTSAEQAAQRIAAFHKTLREDRSIGPDLIHELTAEFARVDLRRPHRNVIVTENVVNVQEVATLAVDQMSKALTTEVQRRRMAGGVQ